jgi:hypothetical protein
VGQTRLSAALSLIALVLFAAGLAEAQIGAVRREPDASARSSPSISWTCASS